MVALLLPCVSSGAGKNAQNDQPAPFFAGTINGHAIRVEFVFGKFDPKKRVVTKRKASNGNSGTYDLVLVNGKPVLGTDNLEPRTVWPRKAVEVIEEIRLTWDGKVSKVPAALFDHIFAPQKKTGFARGERPDVTVSPEPSGEAMIVEMIVGEGAGTDRIHWLFRMNGSHQILNQSFFSIMP